MKPSRSEMIVGGVLGLLLCGCNAGMTLDRHREDDFARLWGLYRQCRSDHNLERLVSAAERMDAMARVETSKIEGVPSWLRDVVAPPPARLAANPEALAGDCLARAMRLAADVGPSAISERRFALAPSLGGGAERPDTGPDGLDTTKPAKEAGRTGVMKSPGTSFGAEYGATDL